MLPIDGFATRIPSIPMTISSISGRALGTLVKSGTDGALGTVTKVTRLEIPVEEDKKIMAHQDEYRIRNGDVVSVRWQRDTNPQTTHVFYDGRTESFVDLDPTCSHTSVCLVEANSED